MSFFHLRSTLKYLKSSLGTTIDVAAGFLISGAALAVKEEMEIIAKKIAAMIPILKCFFIFSNGYEAILPLIIGRC